MSCEQFREEIELLVGDDELTGALRAHLDACPECRTYFDHLRSLEALIADETSFGLTKSEQSALLAGLNLPTHRGHQTSLVSLRWTRYAAAAAVVVLSFIGVTGYLRGWFHNAASNLSSPSSITASVDTGSDTSATPSDLLDNLLSTSSGSEGDLLLENSSTTLDSVTDDELHYLEKNFDVKDVL